LFGVGKKTKEDWRTKILTYEKILQNKKEFGAYLYEKFPK
jgi:hypothetical protein